ncbi:hypothetical protein K2173_001408 [Erythroxylum novogranatense]|uniref:Uncharacterized protein n=1 Tax=Erythroxylum novogranatense TaxID=1862640 RepID=A0AAV8T3L5_9ROSI|nr:hypothetical protein K2173_001408 [Erythroxylum novogranatense]
MSYGAYLGHMPRKNSRITAQQQGLQPPVAICNVENDPDNRRVFENIKVIISRKVLLDDSHKQVCGNG